MSHSLTPFYYCATIPKIFQPAICGYWQDITFIGGGKNMEWIDRQSFHCIQPWEIVFLHWLLWQRWWSGSPDQVGEQHWPGDQVTRWCESSSLLPSHPDLSTSRWHRHPVDWPWSRAALDGQVGNYSISSLFNCAGFPMLLNKLLEFEITTLLFLWSIVDEADLPYSRVDVCLCLCLLFVIFCLCPIALLSCWAMELMSAFLSGTDLTPATSAQHRFHPLQLISAKQCSVGCLNRWQKSAAQKEGMMVVRGLASESH